MDSVTLVTYIVVFVAEVHVHTTVGVLVKWVVNPIVCVFVPLPCPARNIIPFILIDTNAGSPVVVLGPTFETADVLVPSVIFGVVMVPLALIVVAPVIAPPAAIPPPLVMSPVVLIVLTFEIGFVCILIPDGLNCAVT